MKTLIIFVSIFILAFPAVFAGWHGDLDSTYSSDGSVDDYIWGIRDTTAIDGEVATTGKVWLRLVSTGAATCSLVIHLGYLQADSAASKGYHHIVCSGVREVVYSDAADSTQWWQVDFTSNPETFTDSAYFIGFTCHGPTPGDWHVKYGSSAGWFTKYADAKWVGRCNDLNTLNLTNFSMGAAFWTEVPASGQVIIIGQVDSLWFTSPLIGEFTYPSYYKWEDIWRE